MSQGPNKGRVRKTAIRMKRGQPSLDFTMHETEVEQQRENRRSHSRHIDHHSDKGRRGKSKEGRLQGAAQSDYRNCKCQEGRDTPKKLTCREALHSFRASLGGGGKAAGGLRRRQAMKPV